MVDGAGGAIVGVTVLIVLVQRMKHEPLYRLDYRTQSGYSVHTAIRLVSVSSCSLKTGCGSGRPDHVTLHGHLQGPWTLQSVQMTPLRSGSRSPQAAAPGNIH